MHNKVVLSKLAFVGVIFLAYQVGRLSSCDFKFEVKL